MNSRTEEAHQEKKKEGRWSDLPEYQIDWLDYDYVTKCEDCERLRDIYTVLGSGKEGRYGHLENFVEARLLELLPARERKLWVAQRTEPTFEDTSTAASDLDSWASGMAKTDQALTSRAQSLPLNSNAMTKKPVDKDDIFGDEAPPAITSQTTSKNASGSKLPPVRNQVGKGSSTTTSGDGGGDSDDDKDDEDEDETKESTSKNVDPNSEDAIRARNEKRRRYGIDYFKEWDKFDPEAEMKKMEEMEEKEAEEIKKNIQRYEYAMKEKETRRMKELRELGLSNDRADMSEETRMYVAEREKRKGNECFRAKEFDEALLYYSRSIYFDNTQHVTYANRAMVNIRLKKYSAAEEDCTSSLSINSNYTKAISRRGMARHKQGKYLEAIQDFEEALKSKPTSKELKDLLSKSKNMHEEVGGISSDGSSVPVPKKKKKDFKRIEIVEVDSSDDEEEDNDATDFLPCQIFGGARNGFVFKMGEEGLGYYRDGHSSTKKMNRITIEVDSSDEEEEEEEEASVPSVTPASATDSALRQDSHNLTSGYPHEQKEDLEEKTEAVAETKTPSTTTTTTTTKKMKIVDVVDKAAGANPRSIKDAATSAFKAGDLPKALRLFTEASEAYASMDADNNVIERVKCMNNVALCGQQLGNNQLVVDICTSVLELSPENVKALLRRGIAYEELTNYSNALDDMCTIMRIDPSQKSVADSMERLLGFISGDTAPPSSTKAKKSATAALPTSSTSSTSLTSAAPPAPSAPVAPAAPAAPAAPVIPALSAEELKQQGNTAFKAKKYQESIDLYTKALDAPTDDVSTAAILGNRAMAHLKMIQLDNVVSDCTTGLDLLKHVDSNENKSLQVKLMYRRATALHQMGGHSLKSALVDFQTVLKMEPANVKAAEAVESVNVSIGLYQATKANMPVQSTEQKMKVEHATATPTAKKTGTPLVDKAVAQARSRIVMPSTPPKTSFEIEKVRREFKHDLNAWGEYLLLINPKKLTKMMGSSLSEDMLSSMIHGIAAHFLPGHSKRALSFLQHLSKVKRFGTNLAFLSDSDKRVLTTIFVTLSSVNVNQETVKTIRKAYGV